eukprot:8338508-Karenia_brevis.AAC.1
MGGSWVGPKGPSGLLQVDPQGPLDLLGILLAFWGMVSGKKAPPFRAKDAHPVPPEPVNYELYSPAAPQTV